MPRRLTRAPFRYRRRHRRSPCAVPAAPWPAPRREPVMSVRNIAVLRGTLAAVPRLRELPSGSVLAQFDVTTRDEAGTQSVPVGWFDPPPAVAALEVGTELVVVGSVRRRFFRAGGTTQSRTEIV